MKRDYLLGFSGVLACICGAALLAALAGAGCATGDAGDVESSDTDTDAAIPRTYAGDGAPGSGGGKPADVPKNGVFEAGAPPRDEVDGGTLPDVEPSTDGGLPVEGGASGSCAAPGACPSGMRSLGTLSGDTGHGTLTANGTSSAFLKVRVTENDSALFTGTSLKLRLALTSPPGANYDLFTFFDPNQNSASHVECTVMKAWTSDVASIDTLSTSWEDQRPIGGHDDSVNVTIEVRFVSGTCDPTAQWSLLVEGNVQ